MIGRAMLRWPAFARLLSAPPSTLAPTATMILSLRSYATPGRPKSVVGEPSRPVKRAARGASSAKKTAGKQAAAANRALTEEQRAAQKARLEEARAAMKARQEKAKAANKVRAGKEQVAQLKKAALDIPNVPRLSAFTLFASEQIKGKPISFNRGGDEEHPTLGGRMRDVSAAWKELSPSEIEHWNIRTREKVEAARAEYKAAVEKYTPDEIRAANAARKSLNSKYPTAPRKKAKFPPLIDERVVSKPISAYLHFVVSRHASGDLRNIQIAERTKLIAQEWKALPLEEKSKFEELSKQDKARYAQEFKETYGREYVPNKQAAGKTVAAGAV